MAAVGSEATGAVVQKEDRANRQLDQVKAEHQLAWRRRNRRAGVAFMLELRGKVVKGQASGEGLA